MDLPAVDVLALCSQGQAPLTERWVLWLRTVGITTGHYVVPEGESVALPDEAKECFIFFTGAAGLEPLIGEPEMKAAIDQHAALVLVQLTPPEQPAPEHGFIIVPAYSMPREAAREALLRALDRYEVKGLRKDFLWHGRNERRAQGEPTPAWMLALAAALLVIAGGLAIWQWWPMESPPVAVAPEAPAPTPAPVLSPAPEPAAQPAATPAPAPPPADDRHAKAQAHIESLLKSTERSDGYTADQIEHVAAHFADPTFIEEKGIQPAAGVRATLQVLADQFPTYREQLMEAKADTLEDGTVSVLVKTNYVGRNSKAGTEASGGWHTRYVVRFEPDGKPLITRIEFPTQKL